MDGSAKNYPMWLVWMKLGEKASPAAPLDGIKHKKKRELFK